MANTLLGIYDQIHFALQTQTRALSILQEQASTGMRVNRASDDPLAARDILALASQARSLENYSSSIDSIIDYLSTCSTVIDSMTDDLAEAQRLVTEAVGGTLTESQRQITANQINELLEQMVALANTQRMGNYIFSGSRTSTPAYSADRTDGRITSLTYTGSTENTCVAVAPGVTSPVSMVGRTAFGGTRVSSVVFPESGTGVSAGTGTSTVKGVVWLDVVLDGSTYKLSIDGGLTYTAADGSANQAVTDSRTGQVLYVNTSAIAREGTDLVQVSGTLDVFGTLIAVRDALLSGDMAKVRQLQAQAGSVFSEARQYLVSSSVWAGAKINGLTSLKESLQKIADDATNRTSQLQDADIAEVSVDLSRYELLYQMSMSVAARALSKSLLDFLD